MEILILLALVLVNGVFAMSEIAVVAAQRIRLRQMAADGVSGARLALNLAENPSHFLSTIQVGITTIGIFSGAYGEASLVHKLAPALAALPGVAGWADELALAIVVAGITFASLILGELVPKRLALQRPEKIAMLMSRPMTWLSRAAAPFVKFLSLTTEGILRLLGVREKPEPALTEEELHGLMRQGMEAGVIERQEHALVSRIFRLDERKIPAIMTPRVDVVYVDLSAPLEENLHHITDSRLTRFPVCRGGLHDVVGIIRTTDLLQAALSGSSIELPTLVRPALYVPDTVTVLGLLELFKRNRREMALVVDEFGEIQGLVTLKDVLEAVVGDLPAAGDDEDEDIVTREDGSFLIDGAVSLDRLREVLDTETVFPDEEDGGYHTMAGFVMTQLGRVPKVSDSFVWEGVRFEVMDMDRHRVDRVLVSRHAPAPGTTTQAQADSP